MLTLDSKNEKPTDVNVNKQNLWKQIPHKPDPEENQITISVATILSRIMSIGPARCRHRHRHDHELDRNPETPKKS